ncbi:MAG: hypothetical protein WDN27_04410 [Candidatus Saccharibacteria bacterium]
MAEPRTHRAKAGALGRAALAREEHGEIDEQAWETLRGFVNRSGITVATNMSREIIPDRIFLRDLLHNAATTQDDAEQFPRHRTEYEAYRLLNTQGVSEIVTFSRLADSYFLDRVPGHDREHGAVTIMSYQMTHAQRVGAEGVRPYPMGLEGEGINRGADFSYHLFMEPKDAADLRATITADPNALHALNTILMVETFGANPEGWRRLGPQYDAWRESDGGHSKLAIRDDFNAPAEQSQIITY